MQPLVSVVVPTVGRPALARAVASALQQVPAPLEVLVVDDGPDGTVAARCDEQPVGVRVLRTEGAQGAAAARNLGMSEARGELVAFLDDDDVWLAGHLAGATRTLASRPDIDLCAGTVRVVSPSGERVEPTVVHGATTSLLRFYYGRTCWAGRRRRVATPTLVFRREVSRHPMDHRLAVLEDLEWLFRVEQAGHRLLQTRQLCAVVHADPAREAARLSLVEHLRWADRLDAFERGTGVQYLVGVVGRQLARSGARQELDALAAELRHRQVPADLRTVLAAARALARVR